MTTIYPVIMVGGAGTRLWPVSTKETPKQFQPIVSKKSLFQETLLRFHTSHSDINVKPPIIIGASTYISQIENQMAEIDIQPTCIVLEPCPRSTTPVAAIASRLIADIDKNALALMTPSDHHIATPDTFIAAMIEAADTAKTGWITTFGIEPTRPETGFGYIRTGEILSGHTKKVSTFTEKPDAATAIKYLQSREYAWNAGLFLFTPEAMLGELDKFADTALRTSDLALKNATRKDTHILLEADTFAQCPSVSLDYSIMEKTERAAVYAPLSCGWSDVGTWQAISELRSEQVSSGVTSLNNENCFIQTDGSAHIAATGLKDLIIVAHKGHLLVIPKDRSQDVSQLVKQFEKQHQ